MNMGYIYSPLLDCLLIIIDIVICFKLGKWVLNWLFGTNFTTHNEHIFQWFRFNWIQHGDTNTKFFHTSILRRRRCNRILALRTPSRNWINDTIALSNHILSHFENIFITLTQYVVSYHNPLPLHPLRISGSDNLGLSQIIMDSEMIQSIKSFKPLKAPRPDCFHPSILLSKISSQYSSKLSELHSKIFLIMGNFL